MLWIILGIYVIGVIIAYFFIDDDIGNYARIGTDPQSVWKYIMKMALIWPLLLACVAVLIVLSKTGFRI